MKKLILARYGGLSPVKQTHYQSNENDMLFHTAPERKGIYAFLWPYIDWFLLGGKTGKLKEGEYKNKHESLVFKMKKIRVDGYIWAHVDIPKKYQYMIKEEKGSWYKIHSKDFEYILPKIFAYRVKEGCQLWSKKHSNEYKFFFKWFSYDDLEIFIPKKTTIKG